MEQQAFERVGRAFVAQRASAVDDSTQFFQPVNDERQVARRHGDHRWARHSIEDNAIAKDFVSANADAEKVVVKRYTPHRRLPFERHGLAGRQRQQVPTPQLERRRVEAEPKFGGLSQYSRYSKIE